MFFLPPFSHALSSLHLPSLFPQSLWSPVFPAVHLCYLLLFPGSYFLLTPFLPFPYFCSSNQSPTPYQACKLSCPSFPFGHHAKFMLTPGLLLVPHIHFLTPGFFTASLTPLVQDLRAGHTREQQSQHHKGSRQMRMQGTCSSPCGDFTGAPKLTESAVGQLGLTYRKWHVGESYKALYNVMAVFFYFPTLKYLTFLLVLSW